MGATMNEEAQEAQVSAMECDSESASSNQVDRAIEAKALRKVDISVLFLLFFGLLMFQLDRMNLASALTGGFATDINISQDTINLGNQLMFMGIVVLEIPSNMLLQRFGPRKYIPAQVLVFGLVGAMQAFVKGRIGFLMARLMLGLVEAGYIPSSIYTLSTWYTKKEISKRTALLFFGMFGGNAISPLLASGILKLDGARGVRGWQWLFLIEGSFTIVIALLILLCLPGSPDMPKPLLGPGLFRFSEKEQDVLQSRLELDDEGKGRGSHSSSIDLGLVWRTIKHYRRWPHYVSTFCVFSTWSPLTTYSPSIIMALGFDRINANALAAVGGLLALVVVFTFASVSDRTNKRGVTVISAHSCYLAILIIGRQVHPHVGKWSRWGIWTAINSFAVGYHPVHNVWLQLNCREAGERSIGIAMWVMSANSGMMVGARYFVGSDTPFYQTGLRTMIIMVSVGMSFAILQDVIYIIHNRRVARTQLQDGVRPMIYTP